MRKILSALLLVFCNVVYGQKCNCLKDMQYLESQAEHNLPSYYDQVVIQKRQAAYLKHKLECNKIAARLTDEKDCTYLVAKYISFFRDEHLAVSYKKGYFPFSSLDDTDAVRTYYRKEKIYPIPGANKYPAKGIEGLWQSQDKAYIVQVVKHKTPLSDYAALIIKGENKFWTKGQLKFLLKQTGKDAYESIYLRPSRQPRAYKAVLENGKLTIGRINIFHRVNDAGEGMPADGFTLSGKLEFKELSDKTNYLRIPDFSYEVHNAIDSIVKANLPVIVSKPNLIIDVRNNGGGGDRSYQALLPIVFDRKMVRDPITASIYASKDIFKNYNDTKYKNCETKQDSVNDDSTIALMARNIGKFTPPDFDDTIMVDTVYRYPVKVAIIANRWCASTTEGFVITASQSNKVTLFGENTAGMCSYGDWRLVGPPCLPIELSMPTKKEYFLNNADYESTGIPPHVILDPQHEEDWINETRQAMEK